MGYPIWISLVLTVLVLVIYLFLKDSILKIKEIPREIKSLRRKFKKYFGLRIDWKWFSKDTSLKSWRDKNSKQQIIIQNRIDTVLPPLAKTFLDFCEKRNTLMEPYYSAQVGKEAETELDNKKDLKRLSMLESDIALAEGKFQEACKVAKEAGFTVKTSAKEYIPPSAKEHIQEMIKKEAKKAEEKS